jgi:RNA-directed DNA polymerase
MISKRSDEAEAPAGVAEAGGAGQKPRTKRGGAELGAATSGRTKSEDHMLMEEVVERSNLKLAYQRVVENKGAPGVDDVSVPEFKDWLKMHWPSVKIALLEGRYLPRPVRRAHVRRAHVRRACSLGPRHDSAARHAAHCNARARRLGGTARAWSRDRRRTA